VADGIKAKKLRHDGNPVMRWMAGNVTIEVNGTDGVMPVKKKSKDKIDGVTARLMGLSGYLADPDKSGDDHYPATVFTV
jgi:phage terminase large subunit-like protein